MRQERVGSAGRWGPLFGARARTWAETWEGPSGWGGPVYEHVLAAARVGSGTSVLDSGCGAGRFIRLAADRGADVAGVDASAELVAIAAATSPEADVRVADLERLPWPDASFDAVTGFSSFQFADDHVRALGEARRVSRGPVWVVVPTRLSESGIPQVFGSLIGLFPAEALPDLRRSGMYALSAAENLAEALDGAGLRICTQDVVEATVTFPDVTTATRGFLRAGATALAIQHAGEDAVRAFVHEALEPLTDQAGQVRLPGWFRVIEAR
jgi:ubiquinone/menaquinone biosynthesis C-methylase UbiE